MTRPRVTRPDKAHAIVRTWLQDHGCRPAPTMRHGVIWYTGGTYEGQPLEALDTSTIAGFVDWLVWIGYPGKAISCAWECKEPGGKMTDGERAWFVSGPTLNSIITTDCEKAARDAMRYLR